MSDRTGPPAADLLVTLVERHLRLRAKRAWLGTVWPIVAPFLLGGLYVFVFQQVFHAPIPRYTEFLLCGLLPWAFVAMTVGRAITSLSADPELVRKVGRRQELLPLSVVLSYTANLLVTLAIFVVFLAARGHLHPAVLPTVLLPVAATVLLGGSLALAVSLVDVYNHDLQQVLPNLLTIWFFFVPIVYRTRMAPTSLRFLQSVDPMNLIVGQMRSILYFGRVDEPIKMALMVALTATLFTLTVALFRRFAADLPKDV